MKRDKQRDFLLVLHGNKQTGELLLGRIDRLTKRLKKEFGLETVAADGPFPAELLRDVDDDNTLRTWWKRDGNNYVGLDDSLDMIQKIQDGKRIVGLLGFSQGARFVHLLATLNQQHPNVWFPHLKFAIFAAGYTKSNPPEMIPYCNNEDDSTATSLSSLPSLHIWGSKDELVTPEESEELARLYRGNRTYIHPGKHHVPTKGSELSVYLDFIREALLKSSLSDKTTTKSGNPSTHGLETQGEKNDVNRTPDEETAEMQREEIQALEAIFPGAIDLRSGRKDSEDDGEEIFDFPIVYRITLNDMEMDNGGESVANGTTNWPNQPLTIEIQYPVHYPSDDLESHQENATVPIFKLLHQNTVFEFPSAISAQLVSIFNVTARNERGMPCVLSCLYAARDFLDQDRDWQESSFTPAVANDKAGTTTSSNEEEDDKGIEFQHEYDSNREHHPLIRASSPADIRRGNLEGLEIAEALLLQSQRTTKNSSHSSNVDESGSGGGGSFGTYTIGLVGKPSAGKSTFFNAATAFSRQRGQHQEAASGSNNNSENTTATPSSSNDNDLGGASMAAHPFTTIDPNVGYCLVPAPVGSCPEDDEDGENFVAYGSTHGRDADGRRFIPVLLKDVAGLVPGAYQGKGRGNQFLNDLTDATVLIHVVDSSGSADSSGNKIIVDGHDETKTDIDGSGDQQQRTNPLDDLAWIRAELVEWVYSNLAAKWAVISRKGRSKLAGMFSGYGQKEEMIETAFSALEKFLEERYQRDRALDKIYEWDECDVHRLVSLFLGVRFPMALCLNKYDLPSAKTFVNNIQEALPVHGAHVGTPLSAKKEMSFVREQMMSAKLPTMSTSATAGTTATPPLGVWKCLTSAISLREPILVFPVSDMTTFAPMTSLNKVATGDPSLPSSGMIRCIQASDGSPPSCWNTEGKNYVIATGKVSKNGNPASVAKLRDAILMKPGSTVEDVFLTLKRMGALGGEFVRAEASSGAPGERPKPVPKQELVSRKNRVIKIMTNKRTQWQAATTVTKERNRYQSKR
mmetsp:Transcript_11503/g.27011  ORF Transcript_11503/g.27011 Transcript_11503/m.27011 type:complete len:1027 (+) Transcript_11503:153-3233(+)|eukprot:CAMPEP_0172402364 /NCGR_PEP_ID=MMETSP1061-20121228/54064_1 /TAXON_ID=37318 /ORGANISM="Pseudo-nitzschia pungens, Strain cf. pungens" /LENGTH=1026 /DNA_ID=CAMNT_0013136309 /DNA_START=153 /DNA_END=3233 /DNA_ORIENTATION=-